MPRYGKKERFMSEFFAQVGDFFVKTWNETPGYFYAVGGVLLVIIIAIVVGCVVSKKKKNTADDKISDEKANGSEQNGENPVTDIAQETQAEEETTAPALAKSATDIAQETQAEEETSAPALAESATDEPISKRENETFEQPAAKNTEVKNTVKKQKTESAAEEKPAAKKTEHSAIYHVTRRKDDGKWQVKYAKGAKAIKLFDTQAEAAAFARKLADNCDGSVVVHKVTGQIRKLKEKLPETSSKNQKRNEEE